jgi:tryptophanyl-tRNA synthetase
MSKSYGNFIALSDPPEAVKKKVNSMITDAKKIKKGDPGRPEVCNVFTYQGLFNQSAPLENIAGDCRSGKLGCTECKKILDELLSGFLEEKIQKKRREYSVEKVEEILKAGAVRAREFACQTMREVKKIVSL